MQRARGTNRAICQRDLKAAAEEEEGICLPFTPSSGGRALKGRANVMSAQFGSPPNADVQRFGERHGHHCLRVYSSSRPLAATLAQSRNLAHASRKTPVWIKNCAVVCLLMNYVNSWQRRSGVVGLSDGRGSDGSSAKASIHLNGAADQPKLVGAALSLSKGGRLIGRLPLSS